MAPLATSAVGAARAASAAGAVADLGDAGSGQILGRLEIPGRPEHVAIARMFVTDVLGEHPVGDVAVLLTSETVTNAILHSDSRSPGGTVRVTVFAAPDGIRVEVADAGSQRSIPEVKGGGCVTGGHGLFLVETLADDWGYVRGDREGTVWFRLAPARN
jgi:anti-sigma regulatory factor (Ser/Thr protein kinase)